MRREIVKTHPDRFAGECVLLLEYIVGRGTAYDEAALYVVAIDEYEDCKRAFQVKADGREGRLLQRMGFPAMACFNNVGRITCVHSCDECLA